jgi:hypothetical protein
VIVVAHELVGIATPYSAEVVLVYFLRARSREIPHFVDAVCASGLVEWLVRAVGAEETSPVEVSVDMYFRVRAASRDMYIERKMENRVKMGVKWISRRPPGTRVIRNWGLTHIVEHLVTPCSGGRRSLSGS